MTHIEINYLQTKSGSVNYSTVGVINTEYLQNIISDFLVLDEKLDVLSMEAYFEQLEELNKKFLKKTS